MVDNGIEHDSGSYIEDNPYEIDEPVTRMAKTVVQSSGKISCFTNADHEESV